jgi:hypothetical protein
MPPASDEKKYTVYEPEDGIPMHGCQAKCQHSRWHYTHRDTIECPDCLMEWELKPPRNDPHGPLGWRLTEPSLELLVIIRGTPKRKWYQWLFDPYGESRVR